MGNPTDDMAPVPAPVPAPVTNGESASASALPSYQVNSSQRYFDDDQSENDDLPPLYTDHEHNAPTDPLIPTGTKSLQVQPFSRNKNKGIEYYLDRRLDTDPVFLAEHLKHLAILPPRPHVHIRGVHSERVRKQDGKHENKDVVDFDLQLELTHLLYEDITSQQPFLRQTNTVGNFEKVRRGTVFATRAPGFGGSGASPEEGTPSMEEWCHRFCASHAGLKNLVFERHVTGWDFDLLRIKIEALVRATNYRGRLCVSFPVLNARAEIYNECRTNRWRLTRWIEMMFYFTLMFVFAWPWLFFRTKRWEVVNTEWHLSTIDDRGRKRYATLSEERWYNLWARVIQKAILERRQCTLDQGDLNRVDQPASQGVFAAGIEAMGVVNRSFGWGDDS